MRCLQSVECAKRTVLERLVTWFGFSDWLPKRKPKTTIHYFDFIKARGNQLNAAKLEPYAHTKSVCEDINYRRLKKYFRTLNRNTPAQFKVSMRAKPAAQEKPKLRLFRIFDLAFAFPRLQECTNQTGLPHVTLSTTAVCKLCVVEYFCEAKPQKRYLQTVQWRRSRNDAATPC